MNKNLGAVLTPAKPALLALLVAHLKSQFKEMLPNNTKWRPDYFKDKKCSINLQKRKVK